ncbi:MULTISPECIES: gamma-glutamylcyclotransferase family protein [Rhodomicrobium]|uniref:gamma-glutamylcyclotransferase family protein n=1 Tax=Rhodomicrobium TaxID=1068 RepID=UPI000B4B8A8A|nr:MULTISPECIES: gamma-glutamylcyclotransferase family protein [Rhodomicrobium]
MIKDCYDLAASRFDIISTISPTPSAPLLEIVRSIAAISLILSAIVGGIWALWLYTRQKRLERAKWQRQLFKDVYLNAKSSDARNQLEYFFTEKMAPVLQKRLTNKEITLRDTEVTTLVQLDNFLNIFEHTLYLKEQGFLSDSDLDALFYYWFDVMRSPERGLLRRYLMDFGFKKITKHLALTKGADEFVFFYGTLRDAEMWSKRFEGGAALQNYIDPASERKARVNGELRANVSGDFSFPMLRYTGGNMADRQRYVYGSAYKLRDRNSAFRMTDKFERFNAEHDPSENLFIRTCVHVECLGPDLNSASSVIDAWIYVFNGFKIDEFRRGEEIASGLWEEKCTVE